MTAIFSELSKYVNLTSMMLAFIAGMAATLLLQAVFRFILANWKPIVIVSAAAGGLGLLLLGIRGGF